MNNYENDNAVFNEEAFIKGIEKAEEELKTAKTKLEKMIKGYEGRAEEILKENDDYYESHKKFLKKSTDNPKS